MKVSCVVNRNGHLLYNYNPVYDIHKACVFPDISFNNMVAMESNKYEQINSGHLYRFVPNPYHVYMVLL